MRYSYAASHDAGQTYGGLNPNSIVILGAFGYPYPVASRGDILITNLGYDLPGRLAPFAGFKLYNEYGVPRKRVAHYKNSVQNVTGQSFSAGK